MYLQSRLVSPKTSGRCRMVAAGRCVHTTNDGFSLPADLARSWSCRAQLLWLYIRGKPQLEALALCKLQSPGLLLSFVCELVMNFKLRGKKKRMRRTTTTMRRRKSEDSEEDSIGSGNNDGPSGGEGTSLAWGRPASHFACGGGLNRGST